MGIFTLLECGTGGVDRIHDLVGKSLLHRSLGTLTAVESDPTQAESLSSLGANLHGYLIGSTADTASLYLKHGHNVLHCCLKNLKGFLTCLLFDDVKCIINDFLSYALFAVIHNIVDKTGDKG